jgi:hypothetical protein
VAENSLRASQNNTVSQSPDLGRVALPKNPETTVAPANDLTEAKLAPLLSRAELKLQTELASLQQKAPDTIIELQATTDVTVAPKTEVTKTEDKKSEVSYTTKKAGYGVAIPPLIRDPLGFLAALLKIFEKMLLGTLNELNTKPEMNAVQINIKEDQQASLENERAKEAKLRTEKGIASDGSILAEARMTWSGNSDDDNQDSNKEK